MNRKPPRNKTSLFWSLLIALAIIAACAVIFMKAQDAPSDDPSTKTASELLANYEMRRMAEAIRISPELSKTPFLHFLWYMSSVCSLMEDGKIPLHDCSPGEPLLVDIAPHCPVIIAYRETPRKPLDPDFPNQVPDYVSLLPLIDKIDTACAKVSNYRDQIFGCYTGYKLGKDGTHYISAYGPCQGLDDIKPYIDNIRAELKEKSTTTDKGVSPHAE